MPHLLEMLDTIAPIPSGMIVVLQCCWSDEDYAGWDRRDHTASRALSSRCGIIQIAALCPLCRYRHKGHATRHPSRLARELDGQRWGDAGYAAEELVAENRPRAFLCADLEITPEPGPDHASYIASWLAVLNNDKRAMFTAAADAQRAADFLHALQPPPDAEEFRPGWPEAGAVAGRDRRRPWPAS